MENNKKSSRSWIVLGVIFYGIVFLDYLIEDYAKIDILTMGAEALLIAVFGFGGTLFILIGIVKIIIQKYKKN